MIEDNSIASGRYHIDKARIELSLQDCKPPSYFLIVISYSDN